MRVHFKESFEYLMSLSNKELRKEIENSNWNFILQELRYAGDEIERLNNIINELEEYLKRFLYMLNGICDRDIYEQCQLDDFTQIMEKLKELKEK